MTRTIIDESAFEAAVAAAVQAPSMHNSQPWRFRLRADAVEVLADNDRGLPGRIRPAGPRASPAGRPPSTCGSRSPCRAIPWMCAGNHRGPILPWWPSLTPAAPRPVTPLEESLYRAIPRRHSNRLPFWPQSVPVEVRARLVGAARVEAAWLELVTGTAAVAAVAEIAHAANQVLSRNAGYLAELAAWTRPDDAKGDGVPATAGGPSPEPQDLFPQRPFGDSVRAPGRDFEPEPLVGILGTLGDTPTDQLGAGHALQRVLLTVTDEGLAASMLSQPIEVPAAREQLRLALGRHGTPQMVLRIGYGQPGSTTPRRAPADVIDPTEA